MGRRLLRKLGTVYAERRRDNLAVVGRHSYIPGLWSLKREDAVVTLLGELVDGLSAEQDEEDRTAIAVLISGLIDNIGSDIAVLDYGKKLPDITNSSPRVMEKIVQGGNTAAVCDSELASTSTGSRRRVKRLAQRRASENRGNLDAITLNPQPQSPEIGDSNSTSRPSSASYRRKV